MNPSLPPLFFQCPNIAKGSIGQIHPLEANYLLQVVTLHAVNQNLSGVRYTKTTPCVHSTTLSQIPVQTTNLENS